MKAMPHIISAMTPFPHTIEASQLVSQAKALMYGQEIRHLPVTEGGKLVGILSDRDLKLSYAVGQKDKVDNLKVGDVCLYDVYVVEPTERLDTVVGYMFRHKIGSALIAKKGKLVGIFTTTDACARLEELLKIYHPDA